MKGVLDPQLFLIADQDWNDPAKRDRFLQLLLDHLTMISKHDIVRIYWTDQLESLIYELPPWRQDRCLRMQLVPQLYQRFSPRLKVFIDNAECLEECSVTPPLRGIPGRNEITAHFTKLMHALIAQHEHVYFGLGLANRPAPSGGYIFSCTCHPDDLVPTVIEQPIEWLQHINLEEVFWPTGDDATSHDNFVTAIDLAQERLLMAGLCNAVKGRYEIEVGKEFLNSVACENLHRSAILKAIAKRSLLTRHDAMADSALRDEQLKGKKLAGKPVGRFRVTQECRIHYVYEDTRRIVLTDYFGEGKHDEGL